MAKRGRQRNRQDRPKNYWHRDLGPITYDQIGFRSIAILGERQAGERRMALDPYVTNFMWDDSRAALTGTMGLVNPGRDDPLGIKEGHEIVTDWSRDGTGGWNRLWRMRVLDTTSSSSSGALDLELGDDLVWLGRSRDDFSFKKGKGAGGNKRARGWYAHEIAEKVLRDYGVRVGRLARGKHLIKNLTVENTSPLSVIQKAYQLDRDETGRKFVIKMRRGRFTVTELRRSRDLLLVGPHLIEAVVQRSLREQFATQLMVRASLKRSAGEHKKIEVLVESADRLLRRYGVVRLPWDMDDPVDSRPQAFRRARRRLAKAQEPKRQITMTLPGLPTVLRGDALRVRLKHENLNELLYVSGVVHNVQAGDYTMDVTVNWSDPYKDPEGEKIQDKICEKARKQGRRQPGFCREGRDRFAPRKRGRGRNRQDRHRRSGVGRALGNADRRPGRRAKAKVR